MEWWMILEEATLNKLHLNSPQDGWFPALQDLFWFFTPSNPSCAHLFFSQHLKKIHIDVSWPWGNIALPFG